jgi:amino acid transporter
MFASARVFYSLARAKHMPHILTIKNRYSAPWVANLVNSLVGLSMCFFIRYNMTEGYSNRGDGGPGANIYYYSKYLSGKYYLQR